MPINKITKSPTPIELVNKVNDMVALVGDSRDYVLPKATQSTLGGVIVDGSSIAVDGNGKISAISKSSGWNGEVPACWIERGDGSLGDKVCLDGEVFEGTYWFRNFTVPSGITIYIEKTAKICCTETFTNNGTVSGIGRGALGSTGAGQNGIASGGAGGAGSIEGGVIITDTNISYTGSASTTNMNTTLYCLPTRMYGGGGGSNSGAGGSGGAGIVILSKSFFNYGVIAADGANGVYAQVNMIFKGTGAGGGGGIVIIIAGSLKNTGAVSAKGGSGCSNGYAGWYKLIELGAQ